MITTKRTFLAAAGALAVALSGGIAAALLARRGDESNGAVPGTANTRFADRPSAADDEDELYTLAGKVKRILDEEARRFGIDV